MEKIRSELAVTKTVNATLKNTVTELQRKMNHLDQYGRRDNIEISGVPKNVENLEDKMIALLGKIDVVVNPADIVACHPLKREGAAIIRFVNRKHAYAALKNAKKIEKPGYDRCMGKETCELYKC